MDKLELIQNIEKFIQGRNGYINSGRGTAQDVYAWEYSIECLKIVLIWAQKLK